MMKKHIEQGALDMTRCDFSARSARDEMGHIIGSSEQGSKQVSLFFFCCGPHVCVFSGHHDGW